MAHSHEPTCKDVMNHICDNLGEDLDSPKCTEIKNHLEHCDKCQKYYQSIKITIQSYKTYQVKITDDVHRSLMDFLNLDDCEE
ncbi:MAG: hypothetical protein GXO85_15320 [Chlorobi bacterium]|nr:hypothetical protein [Chlorobiota bacterium]